MHLNEHYPHARNDQPTLLHRTQGMSKVILLLAQTTLDHMRNCLGNHADAIDNGTHGNTQGATGTIVRDMRYMRFGIKFNGLIAGISTGHIAFAAIDAQIL